VRLLTLILILPSALLTGFFGLMIVSSGKAHDAWFGYSTFALALACVFFAIFGPAGWRPVWLAILAIPWAYFFVMAR
jgi:hypothetical protein